MYNGPCLLPSWLLFLTKICWNVPKRSNQLLRQGLQETVTQSMSDTANIETDLPINCDF